MYEERREEDNTFFVDLGIEEYILNHIEGKRVVLLTGDAGDGKSRILNNLWPQLSSEKWDRVMDYSALEEQEQELLLDNISESLQGKDKKRYIVAANAGILFSNRKNYFSKVRSLLENPLCLTIDLQKRNLAKEHEQFQILVRSFLSYQNLTECNGCPQNRKCAFQQNFSAVCEEPTLSQLQQLYYALFLKGIHVTIRDFFSSLAFLITRGIDCTELLRCDNPDDFYYSNNFFKIPEEGGTRSGTSLLTSLWNLDPARRDSDDYDKELFAKLNGNLYALNAQKRKDYFENPKKLLSIHTNGTELDLLNGEYLREFQELLCLLEIQNTLDSVEEMNPTVRLIERGLNKLSDPYRTNDEMVLFDSPPLTSPQIKIIRSTNHSFQYVYCSEPFYRGEKETRYPLSDNSGFYCVLYYEDDKELKEMPCLHVDYPLFCEIAHAGHNIFRHSNILLRDAAQLKVFMTSIVASSGSMKRFKVQLTNIGKTSNLIVSIQKPSPLSTSKETKLSISK